MGFNVDGLPRTGKQPGECGKLLMVDKTPIDKEFRERVLGFLNLITAGELAKDGGLEDATDDLLKIVKPHYIEKARQEVIKEIEAMDKRHTVGFVVQALKGGKDV